MLTASLLVWALMALATSADEVEVPAVPDAPEGTGATEAPEVTAVPEAPEAPEATEAPEAPSCPDGWSEHHGRCYSYVSNPMTWAEAEKHCQMQKGNLASAHSAEEYHFIQGVISAQTHDSLQTWIGGSDAQENEVWLWSDGTPFFYSFWCSGEPNNLDGNQACLQMNHGANNCWDDKECATALPSVCAVNM